MDITKKFLVSSGWVIVGILAVYAFPRLRRIGMTWTSNPGFFRLIGLTLFCIVLIAAPVVLAMLAWINRPKSFYKKLGA
jgi:uncharacterized membrane protein